MFSSLKRQAPKTIGDRLFAVIEPLFPAEVRPNHLTLLRFALIPVVAYYLHVGNFAIGVPLFVLTGLTDWMDGALARLRDQVTEWGIFFDPIADKLLIGTVLVLVVLEHINPALGWTLLAVESLLFVAGVIGRLRGGKPTPANAWGKAKMVAEVIGVSLLLLALWSGIDLFVQLSTGTLAVALITALVSILWRIR
ncbi:MAG: hypothetical protein RLZZ324_580 [Candidatus Parcubacteria bacterium]|jgi:cardiolipin synthase